MSDLKIENYVDALLETSSVAAHDISGQIHVMQFCVEELEDHLKESGSKYGQRLQESLDELTGLINGYRNYIKKSSSESVAESSEKLIESVLQALKVNFWNEFKKVDFDLSEIDDSLLFDVPAFEVQSAIFSLMSIYIEECKKGHLEHCSVKLSLIPLDSECCLFTLESKVVVEHKLFEVVGDSSSLGTKVFRKRMGHQTILESDKYKISSETKDGQFFISMKMNILDGQKK